MFQYGFFPFESLTQKHRCRQQNCDSIEIATRDPGYQYSFLDFRLVTARNVQVQKQKTIFNNHACPQFYNTFVYNASKIIWFSVYNVDIVILSKKNIVMSAIFEFAIQKCHSISNLPYGIAPVCFK